MIFINMIRLIDLLKELTTRPKPELGDGEQGWVYPLGKDKVIKKTRFTDGITEPELEDYKIFNQHPDVFPHIYKIAKDYTILDKLDTSLKEFRDPAFGLFMLKNGWWAEPPSKYDWEFDSKTGLYNWIRDSKLYLDRDDYDDIYEDPFTKIFKSVRKNDLRQFNYVLQKAKEQNKTKIYNGLKEILDFCIKINKVFKGEWRDVHKNNIGRDKNGKLKIFDVTSDF